MGTVEDGAGVRLEGGEGRMEVVRREAADEREGRSQVGV